MKIDTTQILNSAQNIPKINEKQIDRAKLREQTDAFEALILKNMLDLSLKIQNPFGEKAAGAEIYESMYKNQIAEQMAGNFGFSELLFNFLVNKR